MQITFSADQLEIARKLFDVIAWPLAWAAIKFGSKKAVERAEEHIHTVVTENSNRIRDEINISVEKYLDRKFQDHEVSAFERIKQIEDQLKELSDILRPGMKK